MPSTVLPYPSLSPFVNNCLTPIIPKSTVRYTAIAIATLGVVWKASELLFPIGAAKIKLVCITAALIISIVTVVRGILLRFHVTEEAEKCLKKTKEAKEYFQKALTTLDRKEKFERYKAAADLGHAEAQLMVASCYSYGMIGVKQDYKKGFEYYNLAAEQGNCEAQFNVGYAYENRVAFEGDTVVLDFEKAFHYYKLAADQGLADALCKIGYLYYKGNGVKEDHIQAYIYAKQAVEPGCENAKQIMEWTRLTSEIQATKELRMISKELHDLKVKIEMSKV